MALHFMKVTGWSKSGDIEFTDIRLPAKCIVCPRCGGQGKHVNPAIDGQGLSQEDFDQDPDFAEGYFSGRYDVRCEECSGEKVLHVPDERECRKRLSWWKGLIRYQQALDFAHQDWLERNQEQRMGY